MTFDTQIQSLTNKLGATLAWMTFLGDMPEYCRKEEGNLDDLGAKSLSSFLQSLLDDL